MVESRSVKEVLVDARKHIVNGWCKHALGKLSGGGWCGNDEQLNIAVKVCAIGAIRKTLGEGKSAKFGKCIEHLNKNLPKGYRYFRSVTLFNDAVNTNKENIIQMYDKAIQDCK